MKLDHTHIIIGLRDRMDTVRENTQTCDCTFLAETPLLPLEDSLISMTFKHQKFYHGCPRRIKILSDQKKSQPPYTAPTSS